MLKNFKKALKRAFTITELVIVIAVIAILAAVLIPTFSNVIENANQSAAMQNCRAAISDYGTPQAGLVVSEGKDAKKDYYYLYMNGGIHLLEGVEIVAAATEVVNDAATEDKEVTFTVTLDSGKDGEPDDWSDDSHKLTITSNKGIKGVYMSKPVTINGTNYVSVFVRQLAVAEDDDPLTNFYSTAYVYSGTYFSWNPQTTPTIAMTDTFTVTVTAPSAETGE